MPSSPENKAFGLGMGLITVGGMLLAIVPLKDDISHLENLPQKFYEVSLVLGVVFCMLGLLSILIAVTQRLAGISKSLQAVQAYLKEKVSDPRFDRSAATEDQFELLFEFSREMFGEEIDQQVRGMMLSWHQKNPEYLWILQKLELRDAQELRRLAGYFSIFPLNKSAASRVDRGELYGASIRAEDMVSPEGRPTAIYIGGIAATTPKARAFALEGVWEVISEPIVQASAVSWLI